VRLPARRFYDQGTRINCCLSCALATCLEARYPSYPALAPLFHYYWARPSRARFDAVTISNAFLASQLRGFCKLVLHDHAFTEQGATMLPTDDAMRDGESRRMGVDPDTGEVLAVWLPSSDPLPWWKRALSLGYPILLGIVPDDAYWALRNGLERWRAPGPAAPGAKHAVAVLGYDDAESAFIVQDSRGQEFGRGGQWFFDYDGLDSPLVYAAYGIGASPEAGLV
jgi:hypothetical protein